MTWLKRVQRLGERLGDFVLTITMRRSGRNYEVKAAVHDAKDSGPAVELIVENTAFYKVIRLDYHGGERYPQLERVSGAPDRLDDILKPEAK